MVYMLYRWNRLVSSSRRRFPAVAGSLVAAGLSAVSGTVPSTGLERESFFTAVLSALCLVPGGKMVICLYLRSRLSGFPNGTDAHNARYSSTLQSYPSTWQMKP